MKFRVKHVPRKGWFAQVRPDVFGTWRTLGKFDDDPGLYAEEYERNPFKSRKEAEDRCKAYVNNNHATDKVEYFPVEI